jgi:hypothetical protein
MTTWTTEDRENSLNINRMEEEFNQWAMDTIEPWPHPQKILQNYWIVWQAAWNRAYNVSSSVRISDEDDGRC